MSRGQKLVQMVLHNKDNLNINSSDNTFASNNLDVPQESQQNAYIFENEFRTPNDVNIPSISTIESIASCSQNQIDPFHDSDDCDDTDPDFQVDSDSSSSSEELNNVTSSRECENTSRGVKKRRYYKEPKQQRIILMKEEKKLKYNVRDACPRTCFKKCTYNFDDERRQEINKIFWNYTWSEQRLFVQNNISRHGIIRHRSGDFTKRNNIFRYMLTTIAGEKVEVCKLFFLSTLGYSKSNDRIIQNTMGKENYKSSQHVDRRGAHAKKPMIDRNLLSAHVESFNPAVSHYRREHAPNKRYLPADITIRLMHQDFISKHPNVKISYELYRSYVSHEKKISFAKLGNEECAQCEQFKHHNKDHCKENFADDCLGCTSWKTHYDKCCEARAQYQEDTKLCLEAMKAKNYKTIYVSVDLEKVIMLPRMEQFKEVLFCRRLIVFNECFVPIGKMSDCNMKPFSAVWHEAEAGRKKEDIISTFHAFFTANRDAECFVIWMDNCGGQNKNWALFSYLLKIVNSGEIRAKTITLKYLEVGHTFMSADSLHHQIELAMKHQKYIYDYDDFCDVVGKANSGNVAVKAMRYDDFYDWEDCSSSYQLAKSEPRAYMHDMVQVTFRRNNNVLFYKSRFDQSEEIELNFLLVKYRNLSFPQPQRKTFPRGITEERKNGIITKLLHLMPENRKLFWTDLPVNNQSADLVMEIED